MRHDGLWHPRLLEILTSAGHTDLIVVCDAGLPAPPGVEVVHLAWRSGEPAFLPVLRQILGEFVVEHATIAEELSDATIADGIAGLVPAQRIGRVSHEEFKRITRTARAIVRTGEVTPYANVILQAGVPYGPAAPEPLPG
ncbi:MAG: D-ribose pyranase [Hamadaea sp.]|uniref:D-ribose pyranase n=1 Tax=Hamadaea sp. TaxID=2024425 RepID=UPI0018465439|nr:D-ribose pyranase [Hamadaea sp.]NUT18566.1 D-ribose pyranase [Hamadaea sp.]